MARKTNNTISIEKATALFLAKIKIKVKESTFSRYNFVCEKHIIQYFKDIELHHLNNKIINNFIQSKLEHGLSAKTVNDIIYLLLQIIKPYCKFDIDIEKPSCRQNEISIFTEPEYNRLIEYLAIGTDSKKLGIIIVMLTGIRIGELCALKWENINLENGTIFINKTMQRVKTTDKKDTKKTKIIIDVPKSTASIRVIPIHSMLLAKLKEFKTHDNSYILTNSTKYIEPRIYTRHFKSYLNACGIKGNTFHTLRHTFATMSISRKMDTKSLSMLLGHTDVAFTMKRYVHPNIEHRRIQIEKLEFDF